MPQFFIQSSDLSGSTCCIRGDDFRHLASVRRARPDEPIQLRDETGAALTGRIVRVGQDFVEVEITGRDAAASRPVDLTLCMCLLKGKHFDLVIEKAVEVGVSRIVPVISERTVPHPGDAGARLARWRRKAEEAAKQSLRDRIPAVEAISSFADAVAAAGGGDRIIAHPAAPASMKEHLSGTRPQSVSLLVGPEGGFSPVEVERAIDQGWTALHLGASQLRAETAALVLCGIIMYEWGG